MQEKCREFTFILYMSNPADLKKVFVVVPAFNEGGVIREVVTGLINQNYTVVLVDDGSDIPVISLLTGLSIHYLRHPVNLGQGAALQTGIEYALSKNAGFIVSFDADGQHQIADIPRLLDPLVNNEADIALGARFITGGKHNMPVGRKILLQVGRWLNYLLTGLLLTDAHNGLRTMNRKAASMVQITENRMAHATELLTQIKKHKLRYKEIPVTIVYTEYSKKKGQTVWSSFRIFFDLLLNKVFK